MKTKILSVSMAVSPIHNFRITKGGKRILTSDPSYNLNCSLIIDQIPALQNGDAVRFKNGKMIFGYLTGVGTAKLVNANLNSTKSLNFNTNEEIELELLFRTMGEYKTTKKI